MHVGTSVYTPKIRDGQQNSDSRIPATPGSWNPRPGICNGFRQPVSLNTTLVQPSGLSRSVLSQVLARMLQQDLLSSVTLRFNRRLATRRSSMANRKTPFERALALAALSGFKIALGPAFLAASRRSPNTGPWALAALGEMFLDKIGVFPPRFRPALLIPHALSAPGWLERA